MKENKYNDDVFFEKYSQMSRSTEGLKGAGEWYLLKKMLPDFAGKRVLDLGCGFGWHCIYAADHGAIDVVGVDISSKMLKEAARRSMGKNIIYLCKPIEDMEFAQNSVDVVLSSLAFHYIESFDKICKSVKECLCTEGQFIFSVEHPVFTAQGSQDWHYDDEGNIQHWPVDRYYEEGVREAVFLGEKVKKYHKTLTTYLNGLLTNGFEIIQVVEARPDERMMQIPGMKDEMRRPMMLLVSARKK